MEEEDILPDAAPDEGAAQRALPPTTNAAIAPRGAALPRPHTLSPC